jgi:hypothetical protein
VKEGVPLMGAPALPSTAISAGTASCAATRASAAASTPSAKARGRTEAALSETRNMFGYLGGKVSDVVSRECGGAEGYALERGRCGKKEG